MTAEPVGSAHTSEKSGHDVTWPQQLDHSPTLRVGDVLAVLSREFASLTPSKLRFLDAQGLVSPQRTPAGYRLYSQADIERLRFVLTQQRDAYAPLQAIKAELDALDEGTAYRSISLAAVDANDSGLMSIEDVARLAQSSVEVIAHLSKEGIISAATQGLYSKDCVGLASACARYLAAGADVRELKALLRLATQECDAAAGAAAPLRRQDDNLQAQLVLSERLEAAVQVFSARVSSCRTDAQ